MSLVVKIKQSLEYGALDHKWLARDYLWHNKDTEAATQDTQATKAMLYQIANSAFVYYNKYYDTLQSDTSIKAITEMCSNEILKLHTEYNDSQVFRLSNIFNQIIESARNLHRCYDCGTNARAMFLKLIEVHRGVNYVTHAEQQQMKEEYAVTHTRLLEMIDKCYRRLKEAPSDEVFIMSLSLQNFGHVWVIEKRYLQGQTPRYHHYQSSYRSHLLLDFIELKDYGRDLHQSLDIDRFFADLKLLLTNHNAWSDKEYRLFAKMFAFIPVMDIVEPDPGFCFTSVAY